MVHFAQKKRFGKYGWIILVLVMVTLVACNVEVKNPDGSTREVPYSEWLILAEQTSAAQTQVSWTGTPTYTPTNTLTPTITSTPTITPSPTITPIPPFNGFLLVNNRTGDEIKKADYQPSCDGDWGMPGVDVYTINNGVRGALICSTPWNRPQNAAIAFLKSLWPAAGYVIAVVVILGFFLDKYLNHRITVVAVQGIAGAGGWRGKQTGATKIDSRGAPKTLPEPRFSLYALTVLVKEHNKEHGDKFVAMILRHPRLKDQWHGGAIISTDRAREILEHYNPLYASEFLQWFLIKSEKEHSTRRMT